MSFLQPWMLFALPMIALPIAIHLIHKRRHRVVEWGAMMFLLQGARMSKGMQRLRQILLLALRTIAVAGLIFGIARPIAGGWLGGLGGQRPDAVLVLLDRSASMSEQVGGASKLSTGVERIAAALANVDATRFACIDSVGLALTALESPADLIDLPIAGESSTQSNLPAMLEIAAAHLRASNSGRAEIWICSDGQSGDWKPEDGRWPALEETLVGLPAGVRVNVLNFAERAPSNLSVRVERAERILGEERAELSLDVTVWSAAPVEGKQSVSVAIDLAGARSVLAVELSGDVAEVKGHRLTIDAQEGEGWGYVELPPDANVEDNRFYFTYGTGALQETVIVCEDEGVLDVLRFAAEAPLSDSIEYAARVLPAGETADLDLSAAAVLLWQAPLPEDEAALVVEQFLDAGGQVLFLPPAEPAGATFLGCSWGPTQELGSIQAPASPTSWRATGDLLRDGDDGTPLPVKALEVRALNAVQGDVTPLASFEQGEALLSRAPTDKGGLYFLGTTPAPGASNLANQGVVLVALVQRSLAAAAAAIGSRGQQDAGAFEALFGEHERLSEPGEDWLLAEHLDHSGVLRAGERLVALNRALDEDRSPVLPDERLLALMPEVELSLVTGSARSPGLVEEVWRMFLIALLVALIAEALLCITESSLPLREPRWGTAAS